MVDEKASIKAFKEFLRESPAEDELRALSKEMETASDRSLAIITASVIDLCLEELLLTKMRTLTRPERKAIFGMDGPLSSSAGKANLGYAFSFYGKKTKEDLTAIRDVRNAFAHHIRPMAFEDEPLRSRSLDAKTSLEVRGWSEQDIYKASARSHFIGNCTLLIYSLQALYQKSLTEEEKAFYLP